MSLPSSVADFVTCDRLLQKVFHFYCLLFTFMFTVQFKNVPEFSKHFTRTVYNFVLISNLATSILGRILCANSLGKKPSQILQLFFETLLRVKIIIFEHASRVKYTEFLLARCLPSSESLNGPLIFVILGLDCTSKEYSSCTLLGGPNRQDSSSAKP